VKQVLHSRVGLVTNIRLGWKDLPRTNAVTITYYKKLKLTAVKSFITLAPGFILNCLAYFEMFLSV
jgi:hypothetical protein